MDTPQPTFDPQSSISKHSARAKQARGVMALAGCFIVMILIILGIANLLQAQPASDSLALGPDSVEEPEPTVSEEGATVRFPVSSAAWQNNFGKQSAISLRMPSTEAKSQSLENLIIIATRYGDALDLSDAVPTLLYIYEWDANEKLQTMALAALHAIGDEEGMERLLALFADPHFRHRLSPRLRHVTHAALTEYIQSHKR